MTDDKPTSTPHPPTCDHPHGPDSPCPQYNKPTGMHKDCPDEDGACFMGREADCPALNKPTGLTDEQIDAVYDDWVKNGDGSDRDFARRIEAIVRKQCATQIETRCEHGHKFGGHTVGRACDFAATLRGDNDR